MYRYKEAESDFPLSSGADLWARGYALLLTLLDRPALWRERRRQRLALGQLDDRMLKDIGLSRADILAETSRPFWR